MRVSRPSEMVKTTAGCSSMHRETTTSGDAHLFDPALDGVPGMLAPEHFGREIEVRGSRLLAGPGLLHRVCTYSVTNMIFSL